MRKTGYWKGGGGGGYPFYITESTRDTTNGLPGARVNKKIVPGKYNNLHNGNEFWTHRQPPLLNTTNDDDRRFLFPDTWKNDDYWNTRYVIPQGYSTLYPVKQSYNLSYSRLINGIYYKINEKLKTKLLLKCELVNNTAAEIPLNDRPQFVNDYANFDFMDENFFYNDIEDMPSDCSFISGGGLSNITRHPRRYVHYYNSQNNSGNEIKGDLITASDTLVEQDIIAHETSKKGHIGYNLGTQYFDGDEIIGFNLYWGYLYIWPELSSGNSNNIYPCINVKPGKHFSNHPHGITMYTQERNNRTFDNFLLYFMIKYEEDI